MTERGDVAGLGHVLRVIEELDDILTALRLLIRACEKRKLHDPTHALELSLELVLRRRNYILNVSSVVGTGPPYDVFPCENCCITYPSAFLLSWIEFIIKDDMLKMDNADHRNSETPIDEPCSSTSSSSLLCKPTCALYFGTRPRADHIVDGVLYPMGAPYVSGPKGYPPYASSSLDLHSISTTNRLIGECDEIDCLLRTVTFVGKCLKGHAETNGSGDLTLAESLIALLYARYHFGFDMDCVRSAEVDSCRRRLSESLHSYDSKLLDETFGHVQTHRRMP